MHPWASYLITKDFLERDERRRTVAQRPAPTDARRAGVSPARAPRPLRARGCVV
ncbi:MULTISPECIES: hypothetical protein [Mumia]|uniref:hypothetical protein n=1 Tax=Mumia TaxID=1546255 RepID=UPI0014234393|nr:MULTISPECIES: hypothetical protein [unclassified Mumia]QMW67036.1 hypothetical protein H4N58_03630 [Mumia sp. ZJ1417]